MSGAVFSRDRRYRYRLWRRWDAARPVVAFVMLNPSTADAVRNDPTVRRCIGFARSWGFGGLEVVNLFAYRATDPRVLRRATDPVGPANRRHLAAAIVRAGLVIAAWGADPTARDAPTQGRVLSQPELRCLGVTRSGAPRHPLYVRATVRPIRVRRVRQAAA
jgi:hypothetical protein